MTTMVNSVLYVISDVLGVPPERLNERSSLLTVPEWDSLAHLNLIATLEQKFGVAFTATDAITMTDVMGLLNVLRQYGVGG